MKEAKELIKLLKLVIWKGHTISQTDYNQIMQKIADIESAKKEVER